MTAETVLIYIAVFATVVFAIQTVLTFFGGMDHDEGAFDSGVDGGYDGHHGTFDDGHHDTFDGHDGHEGHSAHSDSHGGHSIAEYFTIRNIIAFLLGFSWGSLAVMDYIPITLIALPIGLVLGVAVVTVNLMLMRLLAQFNVSGNIDYTQAQDAEGKVTIMVPASRRGQGKVTVRFAGREHELYADTEGDEVIKRGRLVRVVKATPNGVTVEPVL